MTKTILVMENNWLSVINRVLEFNTIDLHKLISIHAEYYPKTNETHIVVTTKD